MTVDWKAYRIDPQLDRVRFLQALMDHLGRGATVEQAIDYVRGEKLREGGSDE
tara:strand:+ start:294 stop:452 length:159 start_codon:yes stop_codon:yes gene_type:complete